MTYIAEIPYKIAGIPCIIGVASYYVTPPWAGSPHTCPSDIDFYGETEIEYDILDRRGRRAEWLERKITPMISREIEQEIMETANDTTQNTYNP